MNNNLWYLDSGYFRHMSEDKNQFKKFKSLSGGLITFEDGSKTIVEGKRSIDIPGLPTFHNFLIINGLKVNLLSISQYCDENHNVQIFKDEYIIYNHASKWITKGTRTLENYYRVSTLTTLGCHEVTLDHTDL